MFHSFFPRPVYNHMYHSQTLISYSSFSVSLDTLIQTILRHRQGIMKDEDGGPMALSSQRRRLVYLSHFLRKVGMKKKERDRSSSVSLR
ncbi:hypothetical protein HanRHA438_Chr15g0695031 [Helianthus annuus]|nr:hypothetical protein HanRHA438_Chr15g0695031 [Helianthus annuus]